MEDQEPPASRRNFRKKGTPQYIQKFYELNRREERGRLRMERKSNRAPVRNTSPHIFTNQKGGG